MELREFRALVFRVRMYLTKLGRTLSESLLLADQELQKKELLERRLLRRQFQRLVKMQLAFCRKRFFVARERAKRAENKPSLTS